MSDSCNYSTSSKRRAVSNIIRSSQQNLALASLVSIGTQLGSQFWVGTVAGPTMFVNLERPTFGFIQSKLFPKYGLIGTATSVIALGGHYFSHRGKKISICSGSHR